MGYVVQLEFVRSRIVEDSGWEPELIRIKEARLRCNQHERREVRVCVEA